MYILDLNERSMFHKITALLSIPFVFSYRAFEILGFR
jgi:hypothetical protein